ncbi:hypothetical protein [Yinghuangia soli]|uniref:Uncharacterized protein n=1 Tax=Yinghuangia soli TaxID=2908204 RepID=A0AA41TZ60_9ACTN|nr:hypothetical protein [Yinghuangia soli]MCF2526920.1 hypothetical protein [Yinghuangia soli]
MKTLVRALVAVAAAGTLAGAAASSASAAAGDADNTVVSTRSASVTFPALK